MTLLREIMLVVVFIFLVLFSANFVLTVLESRDYLKSQLQAHAQDTATSLGLSMTTALAENDSANLELLASAIFDRGYFSEIRLTGIDGTVLLHRENPSLITDIPTWFVELIDLPSPMGQSEITRGWLRLGELNVKAHPGSAYQDLWRITVDFAYLFCFIVIASYALFGIVISQVMRPLRDVESQANAICERQFAVLEPVPRTRELKRVVEAMNRMSTKLKGLFESQVALTDKLRIEASTDPLTGLNNQQAFDAQVAALIDSETGPGASVLLLLQLRDFSSINEQLGFAAADDLLRQVAARFSHALTSRQNAILARRRGADFAAFIPQINIELARVTLERTFQQVASIQRLTAPEFSNRVHVAAVFAEEKKALADLLIEADAGLRAAQAESANSAQFVIFGNRENPVMELAQQAMSWRAALFDIVTNEDFLFHYQPIFTLEPDNTTKLFADEVFVRVEMNGQIISAGTFMPMAERFGLLVELDKLIITRALMELRDDSPDLVLNLSTYSLQSEAFINWLLGHLGTQHTTATKVVFELQEHAVHLAYEQVKQLIERGKTLGYRFSVDHFGTSSTSFGYLRSLDLDYIKIDRSFVSHIDTRTDHQFFVQSVVQIAAARDMQVIAEGVERPEELAMLRTLGIDAAMGYLLGRPGPEISIT